MPNRHRRRTLNVESLETRNLLTGFTAYNGLFSSADTDTNTTFYTDQPGSDAAGLLKDVTTGLDTNVLLSTAAIGVNFGGNAFQPAAGTDAHAIFNGFVDFSAGSSRSIEIESADSYEYTFENLDQGSTYEVAGSAARGNPTYTNRWTLVQIVGAESFTPAHSSGAGVITAGLPANQVAIWFGNNTNSNQGYVAQWLDIDPGADGEFQLVSTQYTGSVPTSINPSGVANGPKGYGISGIRLIENVPSGPPAVENSAATDILAFEAEVSGEITGTGGEVPNVTLYYGSSDGGTNPALDENGYLHTSFRLSDSGEDLALTDADGVIVFAYDDFPVQSEDISYGIDAASVERTFAVPTPGFDNANDTPREPLFSVDSSTFTGSVVVELTSGFVTDTIRYTLNETVPTANSPVYTGPLTISNTTMVRAISVGANGKLSTISSESYTELGATVANQTSDLPIVVVETFGDGIGSGFGDTFIGIIEPGADNRSHLDSAYSLQTRAAMRIRGSSSSGFAKKQYRVEFRDENDEDRKLATLGMPAEADWIFYGPSQFDRVLISNPLMYDLSNQIGRYAVRTRWVEMYLNSNGGELNQSDYVGVYAIMEVIERGEDRVDVEELSTGAGGQPVEGGFIWKNDRGSPYVDPENVTAAQRAFIDGAIEDLEDAAAGPNFTDPRAWL